MGITTTGRVRHSKRQRKPAKLVRKFWCPNCAAWVKTEYEAQPEYEEFQGSSWLMGYDEPITVCAECKTEIKVI